MKTNFIDIFNDIYLEIRNNFLTHKCRRFYNKIFVINKPSGFYFFCYISLFSSIIIRIPRPVRVGKVPYIIN